MKFFEAIKRAEYAEKAFAAAGLDLSAFIAAGDVNALKAHMDSIKPSVDIAKIEADLALANQKAEKLEEALASAKVENDTLSAEKKEIANKLSTAEAAAKSTEEKVSLKARELLAKNGISPAISQTPSEDATKPSEKGSNSISWAEYQAMPQGKRAAFFRNGGRLTDCPV